MEMGRKLTRLRSSAVVSNRITLKGSFEPMMKMNVVIGGVNSTLSTIKFIKLVKQCQY